MPFLPLQVAQVLVHEPCGYETKFPVDLLLDQTGVRLAINAHECEQQPSHA